MACRLSYHMHPLFTWYVCPNNSHPSASLSSLPLDRQVLGPASKLLRSTPQVSSHGWLRPLRLHSWIGAGT
jgi:hypothetical protein